MFEQVQCSPDCHSALETMLKTKKLLLICAKAKKDPKIRHVSFKKLFKCELQLDLTIRALCRKFSYWFTLGRGVGYRCVQTLFLAIVVFQELP